MSIALNATARRATSSLPSTGIGSSRSVRAISSTAVVSRRTGRSPLRATAHPARPALIIPARPNEQHHQAEPVEHLVGRLQRLGEDQRLPVPFGTGTATTR